MTPSRERRTMTAMPSMVRLLLVLPLILLALAGCARINNPEGWSGAVIVGDALYTGTEEGELVALDRRTGERLWSFELLGEEGSRAIYGTPVLSAKTDLSRLGPAYGSEQGGDTLYVGGYDGFLYVFDVGGSGDPSNWLDPTLAGREEVKAALEEVPEPIVGSPAVVDEDCSDPSELEVLCQIVMVGSSDGGVYTFEVSFELSFKGEEDASIRQLHRFETGGKVWSAPAVSDGVAYFGSLDHKVYALSAASGEALWEFETDGAVVAAPVVAAGRVYVGSFDSVFYALNAATGVEEWRFTGASGWYWGAAVVGQGMVFAPSLDGSLYALELGTGNLQWVLQTDGRIVGAPALTSDLLVVGSEDGRVRIASLGDGDLEGACTIESRIRTPLVTDGESVYLGARGNTIRALTIRASGDLDEEWIYHAGDANARGGESC